MVIGKEKSTIVGQRTIDDEWGCVILEEYVLRSKYKFLILFHLNLSLCDHIRYELTRNPNLK